MSATTFPNLYPLQGGLPPAQLKTPLWQQGVAVSLLQQYFGSSDRIATEASLFSWNVDEEQTKLFIGTRDNFVTPKNQAVGQRPAVIVGLGDQQYPKNALGDLMGVDAMNGRRSFQEMTKGAWEFSCLAPLAQEALSLATEIKYFLNAYRQPISQTYGFMEIRVDAMGSYKKQPEYSDEYGCTVHAGYAVEDNFALDQLGLKVSAVRMGLNAR